MLRGEIDLAAREERVRQLHLLLGEAHSPVYVDLSATTFIDSSALGALVESKKRGDQVDVEVVLRSPTAPVRRVLEISGLVDWFTIEGAA